MQTVLYGLAALACPIGMGLMMWMMMRGQRGGTTVDGANPVSAGDRADDVAALRAEIEQLKADRVARGTGGR
jgi:hypothetical protein